MANIEFLKFGNSFDDLEKSTKKYGDANQAYNTVPRYSAAEFASVQQYWNYNTQNNNCVVELCVTLKNDDSLINSNLKGIADEIARLFSDNYQILFTFTKDEIKFIINPVSFVDGSLLDEAQQVCFKEKINNIIHFYSTLGTIL